MVQVSLRFQKPQQYLSAVPPTRWVWHKAFFKGGSGRRAIAQTCLAFPKMPRAPSAFLLKKGHLRYQAISLTPLRRVKALRYIQWQDTPNQIHATDTTAGESVSHQLDSADFKNLNTQARLGRFKIVDSEAVLQAKKANMVSNTSRDSWIWHLRVQCGSLPSQLLQKHLELSNCTLCYQNIAKFLTQLRKINFSLWGFKFFLEEYCLGNCFCSVP